MRSNGVYFSSQKAGLVKHVRGCTYFDNRSLSKKSDYLRCLLVLDRIFDAGVETFGSNLTQSAFKLLLSEPGKWRPGMTAKDCREAMSKNGPNLVDILGDREVPAVVAPRDDSGDSIVGDEPDREDMDVDAADDEDRIFEYEDDQVVGDTESAEPPPAAAVVEDVAPMGALPALDGDDDVADGAAPRDGDAMAPDMIPEVRDIVGDGIDGPAEDAGEDSDDEDEFVCPAHIMGFSVTEEWRLGAYRRLRVNCPAHKKCQKGRSVHLMREELGPRAAEAYLGCWLQVAFVKPVDVHKNFVPSVEDMKVWIENN